MKCFICVGIDFKLNHKPIVLSDPIGFMGSNFWPGAQKLSSHSAVENLRQLQLPPLLILDVEIKHLMHGQFCSWMGVKMQPMQ